MPPKTSRTHRSGITGLIRTIAAVIFFVFSCTSAFTQSRADIDTLHQMLANAKDDTTRVQVQITLCAYYRLGNADSSLFYGQQAVKLSRQINYPAGEIQALAFMSVTLEQQGNLSKSLEAAFKALQVAKNHQLERLTGAALDAIGQVYIILKDYPKALSYLRQEKAIGEANGYDQGLGYAHYNIGVAFEETNQLDSAVFYERRALDNFKKLDREEPLVYKVLGDIALVSRNRDSALNFYRKSLDISITNNERRASAQSYNKIAALYKIMNQRDSAIYYARKGLEESKLIAQKKTSLEAATLLSELYETTDTKEALRYLMIADNYKDSLFGTGNLQAIQTLVSQEEEHQKEIVAAKIGYENRLKQYALMAGLATLLLVAAILYRNNRQKQSDNFILQKQKEEIQSTLVQLKATQTQLIQSEKMASLGELTAGIAHEIQNPLNFVNNFSELNTELLTEMKDALDQHHYDEAQTIAAAAIDNQKKINHHGKRAENIVKGMLQHTRSGKGVKEPTDINALASEYLRLASLGWKDKHRSFSPLIQTDFDPQAGMINIVPQDIGRVLQNLYNNAFYAVAEKSAAKWEGYQPMVTVQTKKMNNTIEIRVQDNGMGIPENIMDKIFQPFYTTKPTGQGTGLGLSLSYDLVKANGGEIRVETNAPDHEGAGFLVQLPAH